jgi:hypothetical protein
VPVPSRDLSAYKHDDFRISPPKLLSKVAVSHEAIMTRGTSRVVSRTPDYRGKEKPDSSVSESIQGSQPTGSWSAAGPESLQVIFRLSFFLSAKPAPAIKTIARARNPAS